MKVNFNQEIKKINGESIANGASTQTLLKDVAVEAILAVYQDEHNLPGADKAKRFVLATRIYANPADIDLTVEEVADVKKLIGKAYGPLIVGQAFAMLDQ
jgi:hypothetical protein